MNLDRAAGILLGMLSMAPAVSLAQSAEELATLGHAALERRDPRVALVHFAAAFQVDSMHYGANWGAALALIQLGGDFPQEGRSPRRDALYHRAEELARRAVAADSADVEGWFVLANAMGRASLTRSNRERVRQAADIRSAARTAVALDPRHAGAWHVLGRWHAEVMRLSGIQRFFARNFLGGRVLGEASWDSAIAYLERAAELNPERIVHRVALAGVYADRGRYGDARTQLAAVDRLADVDYGDDAHRREAAALLLRVGARPDRRRQPRYRSRAESIPSSIRSRSSRRRRRNSRRVRREASPTRSRVSSPSSRARRASSRRVSSPVRGEKRSAIPAPITAPRMTPAIIPLPRSPSVSFMMPLQSGE
jgi:tetratricopeptide (TPR) repeat protein